MIHTVKTIDPKCGQESFRHPWFAACDRETKCRELIAELDKKEPHLIHALFSSTGFLSEPPKEKWWQKLLRTTTA